MAYLSSTVGSSANPPQLVSQGISSRGLGKSTPSTDSKGWAPKTWVYNSTHTGAAVAAAGFFTDAKALGMSLGDIVMVVGSTTYTTTAHAVTAVTSTGASLSTGISFSS